MRTKPHHFLARALAAILLLITVGCAPVPPRTAAEDAAIRSVAVVSMVNEQTEVRKVGLTVFNNKTALIDQTDVLNRALIDTLEARLKASRPNWMLKDARSELQALKPRRKALKFGFNDPQAQLAPDMAALASRLGADAVLLIVERQTRDTDAIGMGVTYRSISFDRTRDVTIRNALSVHLYDAKGQALARHEGGVSARVAGSEALGLDSELAGIATATGQQRLRDALMDMAREAVNDAAAGFGY